MALTERCQAAPSILAAVAGIAAILALPAVAARAAGQSKPPETVLSDLDRFMESVLERRDETWKTLHDYVLDERERFEILGPADVRLHGMNREFTWYIKDGYFVRSPLRFDGVMLGEEQRRVYEERWLSEERRREERRDRANQAGPGAGQPARPATEVDPGSPSLEGFVSERGEPRFVSEAYFLRFKFEPGHYYVAGRETIDGRAVVRVEYYPTRLYADRDERRAERAQQDAERGGKHRREVKVGDEDDMERKLNKVALITLWVDPAAHQIVRYTFDNVDFGFLPGRWLVRVDDITATMDMAPVFENVWLPRQVTMRAGITLAPGSYRIQYERRFSDYKKAETRARIRSIGGER